MIFIPKNEAEYKALSASIEPLLTKQGGFSALTQEEEVYLIKCTEVLHEYERRQYPLKQLFEGIKPPQTIPDMLRLKMYERNIKQHELASLLGLTTARLSEIMNGKRKVSMEVAKRLHQRLEISAEFILQCA